MVRRCSFAPLLAIGLAACDAPTLPPAPATSSSTSAAPSAPGSSSAASSASAAPSGTSAPAVAPPRSAVARALDAVIGLKRYRNLTISRDGAWIAYSVALEPLATPSPRSVFVIERKNAKGAPKRVTAASDASADEHSPDFSPDGKTLVLLSGGKLHVVDLAGSAAPRAIGKLEGSLASPRFSPDGKSVAVLQTDPAPPIADPSAPVVSGTKAPPQRIAIVDVATGDSRFASPPDLHVYEFDWSPDSRSLAFTASVAAAHPDWFTAKLLVVDATGGAARVVFAPPKPVGDPRWSPDGKNIAFISGTMSDEGNTGGDLFVVPAEGGAAKNLTADLHVTIVAARWQPDSKSLLVNSILQGRGAISSVAIDEGKGDLRFRADAMFRGLSVAEDGLTVAFLHDAFDQAQSIWSGPVDAPGRVEATSQPFAVPWGAVSRLGARSDEHDIQSFLVAPHLVEPGRKYPLVVLVHGGPAASWVPGAFEYGALATGGYFLLLPNPRGSFGGGEKFQEANTKDFGAGDLRDIRASVRAALEAAPIDRDRVGIAGWSYGGFMAMWAVTQTKTFRAAVAGAGIADWPSYYGQTDVPGWMPQYFGATAYDDPAAYAKASPIGFAKRVTSPTLFLVGERDTDCPAPQSRQMWQALEAQGVPTELVVYPGERHGFTQIAHRRDRVERMAAWFDRHMKPR